MCVCVCLCACVRACVCADLDEGKSCDDAVIHTYIFGLILYNCTHCDLFLVVSLFRLSVTAFT